MLLANALATRYSLRSAAGQQRRDIRIPETPGARAASHAAPPAASRQRSSRAQGQPAEAEVAKDRTRSLSLFTIPCDLLLTAITA
jgi:hypothetical protein